MIVRSTTGRWLIVDFKLALLERARLTRAKRPRRRFVDPVADGIAQLARYADYFTSPANAGAAAARCGEPVNDPALVLVVGHDDNFDAREVEQAKRAYRPVDVIDYDTLTRLFLGAVPR